MILLPPSSVLPSSLPIPSSYPTHPVPTSSSPESVRAALEVVGVELGSGVLPGFGFEETRVVDAIPFEEEDVEGFGTTLDFSFGTHAVRFAGEGSEAGSVFVVDYSTATVEVDGFDWEREEEEDEEREKKVRSLERRDEIGAREDSRRDNGVR